MGLKRFILTQDDTDSNAIINTSEEVDTQTHTTNWSGIWASAQAGNITYCAVGKIVTLSIPLVTASSNTAAKIVNDTALPVSLRPAAQINFSTQVKDDGVFDVGMVSVKSTGIIEVGLTITDQNFSGTSATGTSGIKAINLTYLSA